MVNKQYKIQHIIDKNCKNIKTTKTTTPVNYKSQYFGEKFQSTNQNTIEPKTFLITSNNTPSFTSYESIGTINSSLIENSITVPKPKRSSLNLPTVPTTKSRFSNNFEDQNFNQSTLTYPSKSLESSIYGRNIKMSYSGTANNNSKDRKNQKYLRGQQTNQPETSDLTINDIGRFQYILQMDKELGTYPESYYHLSSKNHQHQNSLNGSDLKSLSLNSSNGQNFWKAGSDYPIQTSLPSTSISSSMSSKPLQFRNRASEMFYWQKHDLMEHSRAFWSYTKWPIILLLSCLVLSSLIFLLFLMSTTNTTRNSSTQQLQNTFDDHMMSANFSDERISLSDFDEMGKDDVDDQQSLYNDFNFNDKYNNKNDDDLIHTYGNDKDDRDEIVTIFIKSPNNLQSNEDNKIKPTKTPPSKIFLQEIDFELETGDNDNNNHDEKFEEKIKIIQKQGGSTTRNPLIRNTQIMKFTTNKGFKRDEDILVKSTTETFTVEKDEDNDKTILSGVLPPTKETLQVIGFTSGHQNNFGVPIEEDERILRLLNEEIIKYESQENSTTERTSTTTVKVSPTLPVIIHHKDTSPSRYRTTTESMMSMLNSTEVCESTSLEFCQGVLRYDLTTTKSKRKLESMDFEHFKFLITSNCSNRAAEFICSVLEPECRSAKLGSLQPCKRICKSILEPCAGLISSSEILTMTFDCDRYPDSSDRNVCEDPTRRGNNCYDNEFQCLDSTCIPKQWKCDNIKDCPLGEDEENCQFCHHDEFQCQSDGKCITEKWHCDGYNDCDDASDENDCDAYDELNDEFNDEDNIDDDENENIDYNTSLYNLFSDQIENTSKNTNNLPNGLSFLAISPINEDTNIENLKYSSNSGLFGTDTINNIQSKVNLTANSSKSNEEEDDEIQTGEASGRIIVGVPHNQEKNNFQDSTEIMMTSDSENDFKYSKIIRGNNRNRNGITTTSTSNKRITSSSTTGPTTSNKKTTASSVTGATRNSLRLTTLSRRGSPTITTTTPEPISTKLLRTSSSSINRRTTLPTTTPKENDQQTTLCPGAKLRCVSGKCITVDQLCDRIIDCPDGADEARCVYKDNDEAN